jgi:hypothetical protein
MEEEKEYSGIWKDIGCVLSAIAILGILALFVVLGYLFFNGF